MWLIYWENNEVIKWMSKRGGKGRQPKPKHNKQTDLHNSKLKIRTSKVTLFIPITLC